MIKNMTTGNVLGNRIKVCNTVFSKAKGLMFAKELDDCGYIFEFKRDVIGSIHMLFVFLSIDIIWLDKHQVVIEQKENIKPFTLSVIPRKKCRYFIELPAGTINKTKTKPGNKINWKN